MADGLTDELYDMKNDPEELNNLIAEPGRADVAEQMKAELERLKTETGFRFP
ncbi:MAG: sulfatase/phosphatase domain-containing protein [Planctomycetota bacterium]